MEKRNDVSRAHERRAEGHAAGGARHEAATERPGHERIADREALSADELFELECAAWKRDEGTERDPIVQALRAAERLRRPIV